MSSADKTDAIRPMRNPSMENCKFFTIGEIAQMLGVSMRTVHRCVERGDLVVHRFGTAVRVANSDLKIFLALHRED